jgi:hypothetical protein
LPLPLQGEHREAFAPVHLRQPGAAWETFFTLRASGLDMFLQVGDFDFHGFHEGAEFLHRVLWDRRIQHEYRLVRAMDHGGATVTPHLVEAFRFFGRVLVPVPEDAAAARIRASKRERLRRDGVTDTEFWPAGLRRRCPDAAPRRRDASRRRPRAGYPGVGLALPRGRLRAHAPPTPASWTPAPRRRGDRGFGGRSFPECEKGRQRHGLGPAQRIPTSVHAVSESRVATGTRAT